MLRKQTNFVSRDGSPVVGYSFDQLEIWSDMSSSLTAKIWILSNQGVSRFYFGIALRLDSRSFRMGARIGASVRVIVLTLHCG